jgi:hypothetical protein
METNIASLDLNKTYNYAQYLTWRFQERVELLKGKVYKMSPASARRHQQASGELYIQIVNFCAKRNVKSILLLLMLGSQKEKVMNKHLP